MEASYIIELIKREEDAILSLPTTIERIERVIEIASQAPVSSGTPAGFEFIEAMNVESSYLIQTLKKYKSSGRVILIPNGFCVEEVKHVTTALDYIYELCEKDCSS